MQCRRVKAKERGKKAATEPPAVEPLRSHLLMAMI
jgi:hypothetical protein